MPCGRPTIAISRSPGSSRGWRFRLERRRDPESADFDRGAEYRAAHPLEAEPAPYAGASVAGCHRSLQRPQQKSLHSRTFRNVEDITEQALPLPNSAVADPHEPNVEHTLKREGRTIRFETRVDGQVFRDRSVRLRSGDRGLTLVGRDEAGQSRELRLSRYADAADTGSRSGSGAGWDLTTGQVAHPGSREECLGHRLPTDTVRACFDCHSTDSRAARDRQGPTTADHGIGCEPVMARGAIMPWPSTSAFPIWRSPLARVAPPLRLTTSAADAIAHARA